MKYLTRPIAFLLVLVLANSCDEKVTPSSNNMFTESVADTWVVNQESLIILDGQDITSVVLGFEITIDNQLNYTTTSEAVSLQPFPWPQSGSFQLNDQLNQFTRNDGLIIGVLVSNDKCLTLTFQFDATYDDSTSGRTRGIAGEWSMALKRK